MADTALECAGGLAADGTRICLRHGVPVVNRDVAQLRGFTEGMPDFGLAWFCPVSGCPLGDFGEEQAGLSGLAAI